MRRPSSSRRIIAVVVPPVDELDLVGPLRLRLDYRIFKLGSDAVYGTSNRFTVGANIAF